MSKKSKEIMILLIIIFFIMCIIFGPQIYRQIWALHGEVKNFNKVQIPTLDNINSIIFFEIDGNLSVKRTTISDRLDIETIIKILNNSKKTYKESVTDVPDKRKFTMVACELIGGGYPISSIYKEKDSTYFEQSYYGIFKLKSNDLYLLNEVIEKGEKQNKLTTTHDIFMGDF